MIHIVIISVIAALVGVVLQRLAPGLPDPVIWGVMTFIICAFAKPMTPQPVWRRMSVAMFGGVVAATVGWVLWG